MAVPHIALTGGIGTGKSTVSSLFRSLGIPVFDFDKICHGLISNCAEARQSIVAAMGSAAVLDDDGSISRQKLGRIVFSDAEKRRQLEQVLHPRALEFVNSHFGLIVASPYVVSDIPLLRSKQGYHRVLLVTSKDDNRIARVRRRDGRSVSQVLDIIRAQPASDELLDMADDVIRNDSDLGDLSAQVAKLHLRYSALCP